MSGGVHGVAWGPGGEIFIGLSVRSVTTYNNCIIKVIQKQVRKPSLKRGFEAIEKLNRTTPTRPSQVTGESIMRVVQ